MTCIVAFKTDKHVILAGDFMASNGFNYDLVKSSKVYQKNDEICIGYTSSFRLGQILEYYWTPPARLVNISEDQYIYIDLVESLRKVLKDYGYGKDETFNGSFILTYKDRLFNVQSDCSILEYDIPIVSVGSGSDIARGILYSKYIRGELKSENIQRILSDLFASINYVTCSVSAEHSAISIPREDVENVTNTKKSGRKNTRK
jgi:20S proteasome alpha/beta subunit